MNNLKSGIEILISESSVEEQEEKCDIKECGIDKLIKEEEDAIKSYTEAIEHFKDKPEIVARLEEIKKDEEEHLKELNELKEKEEE